MSNALAPDNAGLLFTRLYSKNGQSHFGPAKELLPFVKEQSAMPFHRCVINTALNNGQVNVFSNPTDSSTPYRLFNAPTRVLLFILSGQIKVGVYQEASSAEAHLPLYQMIVENEVKYLDPYKGTFTTGLYYQAESRLFDAGDVILAEDIEGLGHTTQMTEQDLTVVIPLEESQLSTCSE